MEALEEEVRDEVPQGIQYARLDKLIGTQDYAPGEQCVRLTGVSSEDFERRAFNSESGCKTFVIDIALRDLERLMGEGVADPDFVHMLCESKARSSLGRFQPGVWPSYRHSPYWEHIWFEVAYEVSNELTASYSYAMFGEGEPNYLNLQRLSYLPGPPVNPPTPAARAASPQIRKNEACNVIGFHVGQGMCSLLRGQSYGLLFDAGSGTPLKRPIYRKGKKTSGILFQNELRKEIDGLSLDVVLSHADTDHWRLLEWDGRLMGMVDKIYLPDGAPSLALSSSSIKSKLVAIGDTQFGSGSAKDPLINIFRSQPSAYDSNGDCLVVELQVSGKSVLFPGDYVYTRMVSDKNTGINNLAGLAFDAVVVPHHGDVESSLVTVQAKNPSTSIAFFSAGDHAHHKHPQLSSLKAHHVRGFDVVAKQWLDDIDAHGLL